MRTSFFAYLSLNFPTKTLIIAEIGTLKGINAIEMAKVYPNSKIYTIDSYPEGNDKYIPEMKINIESFKQIEFIYKPALEAVKDFQDYYFDYVYLDGNHSREAVYQEIAAWYPKVKWGGMLAGHDFWYEEVKLAVLDICVENNLNLYSVNSYLKKLDSRQCELCDWWIWK